MGRGEGLNSRRRLGPLCRPRCHTSASKHARPGPVGRQDAGEQQGEPERCPVHAPCRCRIRGLSSLLLERKERRPGGSGASRLGAWEQEGGGAAVKDGEVVGEGRESVHHDLHSGISPSPRGLRHPARQLGLARGRGMHVSVLVASVPGLVGDWPPIQGEHWLLRSLPRKAAQAAPLPASPVPLCALPPASRPSPAWLPRLLRLSASCDKEPEYGLVGTRAGTRLGAGTPRRREGTSVMERKLDWDTRHPTPSHLLGDGGQISSPRLRVILPPSKERRWDSRSAPAPGEP